MTPNRFDMIYDARIENVRVSRAFCSNSFDFWNGDNNGSAVRRARISRVVLRIVSVSNNSLELLWIGSIARLDCIEGELSAIDWPRRGQRQHESSSARSGVGTDMEQIGIGYFCSSASEAQIVASRTASFQF